ncbi:MAG: GTP-sensing pleiotropic transcriptional regulator CodY [Synergistaceae bacterium]|nr:GTP-sensing pleiotropic transcriptional regulator CodY [Synergistaceae bacterium]
MAVERRVKTDKVSGSKAGPGRKSGSRQGEDGDLQDLLDKTRQVGRALQNRRDGDSPDYTKLAKLLSEILAANVYVLCTDGSILGYAWVREYNSKSLARILKSGYMPEEFVEKMNMCRESELNDADAYMFDDETAAKPDKYLMYVPIYGAGAERLGTVILARVDEPFLIKDVLLAEYVATLVGLEMLNDRNRSVEERSRDRLAVQMAMRALSYSEVESMKHIMGELGGHEGVAVASKVADRVGVTRSVIVNALRKLESAGLIESRSLGMKGTYIKVLSPLFVEELGTATSPRVNY